MVICVDAFGDMIDGRRDGRSGRCRRLGRLTIGFIVIDDTAFHFLGCVHAADFFRECLSKCCSLDTLVELTARTPGPHVIGNLSLPGAGVGFFPENLGVKRDLVSLDKAVDDDACPLREPNGFRNLFPLATVLHFAGERTLDHGAELDLVDTRVFPGPGCGGADFGDPRPDGLNHPSKRGRPHRNDVNRLLEDVEIARPAIGQRHRDCFDRLCRWECLVDKDAPLRRRDVEFSRYRWRYREAGRHQLGNLVLLTWLFILPGLLPRLGSSVHQKFQFSVVAGEVAGSGLGSARRMIDFSALSDSSLISTTVTVVSPRFVSTTTLSPAFNSRPCGTK